MSELNIEYITQPPKLTKRRVKMALSVMIEVEAEEDRDKNLGTVKRVWLVNRMGDRVEITNFLDEYDLGAVGFTARYQGVSVDAR